MPFSKIAGLLDEAAVWPLTTASVSFISKIKVLGNCIPIGFSLYISKVISSFSLNNGSLSSIKSFSNSICS